MNMKKVKKRNYPLTGALLAVLFLTQTTDVDARSKTAIEAVDPENLRVCADPNNLPFSNRKKEGFENQIANLLSEWLDKPLTYTWFPSAIGFVHNTLTKKKCDVIIGIPTGSGKVLNTNPYYRYAYSIIYRKDSGIQVDRIDHPEMANLRIGTIAGTPPNIDLHAFNLMSRVRPYNLTYNTLVENPNERMIEDLESGLIDIALLSGPIGAYYGKKHGLDVTVIPMKTIKREGKLKGLGRNDYFMSMGVRAGEIDWKRKLNTFLRENKKEVKKILEDYGIPTIPMRDKSKRD
jgi:quinoprotein dehydrogenase-associated probable ABC transporter substrate-binding protein